MPSAAVVSAAHKFTAAMPEKALLDRSKRDNEFFRLINRKFEINKPALSVLYAACAKKKITFNYHEKTLISDAFDRRNEQALSSVFGKKLITTALDFDFSPASREMTLKTLLGEMREPTLTRKDSKPKDWSGEIIDSLFGGFIFSCFEIAEAQKYFDEDTNLGGYEQDFWKHLHGSNPHLFSRDKALSVVLLSDEKQVAALPRILERNYSEISNHGHIALILSDRLSNPWRTAAYAILHAEKFQQLTMKKGDFRKSPIEKATKDYIPYTDVDDVDFATVQYGFHYKDTFFLDGPDGGNLLLVFQKNDVDETLIPCPACRSHDVRGNSYSSLGVKSWECGNTLCPDRTKFNRGKRYSFFQLLKQQAIRIPENEISPTSVKRWSRDVQYDVNLQSTVEMLIRHYSLFGDGVSMMGLDAGGGFGRNTYSQTI